MKLIVWIYNYVSTTQLWLNDKATLTLYTCIIFFTGERGPTGQKGDTGPPGPSVGGAVYTRWGRTTCPSSNGTQLVYAGRAAGSWFNHKGGAAAFHWCYHCLPNDPSYLQYRSTSWLSIWVWVYETRDGPLSAFHDQNVPCAVCYVSTRGTVLMIPAKTICPPSWTREYNSRLPDDWTL